MFLASLLSAKLRKFYLNNINSQKSNNGHVTKLQEVELLKKYL